MAFCIFSGNCFQFQVSANHPDMAYNKISDAITNHCGPQGAIGYSPYVAETARYVRAELAHGHQTWLAESETEFSVKKNVLASRSDNMDHPIEEFQHTGTAGQTFGYLTYDVIKVFDMTQALADDDCVYLTSNGRLKDIGCDGLQISFFCFLSFIL